MSPLRAVENTQTPISTSPENFSIAPIAACWKMSMRRRPFSAGSSIEPDTSMTASMRERSVSTAQARRISSCAAASRSVRRPRDPRRRARERRACRCRRLRGTRRRRAGRCPTADRRLEGGEQAGPGLGRIGDVVGRRALVLASPPVRAGSRTKRVVDEHGAVGRVGGDERLGGIVEVVAGDLRLGGDDHARLRRGRRARRTRRSSRRGWTCRARSWRRRTGAGRRATSARAGRAARRGSRTDASGLGRIVGSAPPSTLRPGDRCAGDLGRLGRRRGEHDRAWWRSARRPRRRARSARARRRSPSCGRPRRSTRAPMRRRRRRPRRPRRRCRRSPAA